MVDDHNPIITTAELSLIPTNDTINCNGKRFYKFPWKNESFVERYKIILSELLVDYNYALNENLDLIAKSEYVGQKLDQIRKILIEAARKADINTNRKVNNKEVKKAWTPELKEINEKMIFCGIKNGLIVNNLT
jgi:hypothetical protein